MFDEAERERVRARLVELARGDERIVAAALTGSLAGENADEWSDIDLALALRDDLSPEDAATEWTALIDRELGVIQHWDLPWRTSLYRVFLLPSLLEVDLAFVPREDFAAQGPSWRLEFGESGDAREALRPDPRNLAGLGWHHVRHARASIARGKPLQAAYLIDGVREHTIALACLRLGLPSAFARGADRLPAELRARLERTLPGSLDDAELLRALRAAADVLADEVDPSLGRVIRDLAAV